MNEAGGTSRRAFLGRAAGVAAVAAGAGVGAGALTRNAGAANKPTFTAGRFALDIDGVSVGRLAGVDGGFIEGNVVLDPVGSDGIQRKHLAGVKYEDLTLQVGSGMEQPMYDWIKDSFGKGVVRKNGTIRAGDFSWSEKSENRASKAYISSVTIPDLERSSKDPVYVAVTLTADKLTPGQPTGQPIQGAVNKSWIPSNFVFELDGVDTSRVASIDSFTWKCTVAADGSIVMDVSDLGITFPRADGTSWRNWYKAMLDGVNDEREGKLTLIGDNGGAVCTFTFSNVGLYKLYSITAEVQPAGRVKQAMAKAVGYVEAVGWDIKSSNKI